jgi:hypothetical protein
MMSEAKEEIREVVREKLIPGLKAAIRESITKELESAAFEYEHKVESEEEREKEEISAPAEEVASQPQTAVAEEAEAVAESKIEPAMAREIEVEGDQELGFYLYGIADANVSTKLGEIGIEGNEIYTIPYKAISAIVHNCPLEPYKNGDDEVVKGWVKTHQHVLDVATEKFGTVMPFGFDTIIKPEDNATTKEVLKRWMSEEFDGLMEKMGGDKGQKGIRCADILYPLRDEREDSSRK